MHTKKSQLFTILFTIFIHLNYLGFLFLEVAQLFQSYSLCFEVPIILEIIPAYSAHSYL